MYVSNVFLSGTEAVFIFFVVQKYILTVVPFSFFMNYSICLEYELKRNEKEALYIYIEDSI